MSKLIRWQVFEEIGHGYRPMNAQRWDANEPQEVLRHIGAASGVMVLRRFVSFGEQIAHGSLPVYGLVDSPFGLRHQNMGMQSSKGGVPSERVTITYLREQSGRDVELTVTSTFPPFDDAHEWAPWGTDPAERLPRTLTLRERTFAGELQRLVAGRDEFRSVFQSPDVVVSGKTFGLSSDQLMQVLQGLMVLNDRLEALEQQKAERREALGLPPIYAYQPPPIIIPDLESIPPTVFEQVRQAIPALLPDDPQGRVAALSSVPEYFTSDGRPHLWSVSIWQGSADSSTSASRVIHRGEIVPGPGSRAGARFIGGNRHRPSMLFALADGPHPDLLDSDAAVRRMDELGGEEYKERTGARVAALCLNAERNWNVLWAARYQREDAPEYLLILIDACTGELVFMGEQSEPLW